MMDRIPERLFGMPLSAFDDDAAPMLPRAIRSSFDIVLVRFGNGGKLKCHALLPKERPGMKSIRAAIKALERVDDVPSVLFWPSLSYDQKESLAGEAIPYVQDKRNAFLPFLGAVSASSGDVGCPATLSVQAQRLFLNYLSGRWVDCSAGDIAGLVGKSRASVSKYLSELTAIYPAIVTKEGKSSLLRRPSMGKDKLLEMFEPYLSDPVIRTHRYNNRVSVDGLRACGAKVAGVSELSVLSDLANNGTVLEIAMDAEGFTVLEERFGDSLQPASWDDEATLIVYEWAYIIDGSLDELMPAYGLDGLDPENLYVSLSKSGHDDVRVLDAIEQVRDSICQ